MRADATTEDLNKKLKEVTETVSEKWEEADDKPALVTLGVYGLVGLIAANGVLKSVDGLPLIDLLELVGIGFSGFYICRTSSSSPTAPRSRTPSPRPSTRSSEEARTTGACDTRAEGWCEARRSNDDASRGLPTEIATRRKK